MPPTTPANPVLTAQVTELGKHTTYLDAILAQLRSESAQVAVSDAVQQEMTLEHFPTTGVKRLLARRTGNGTDVFAVPTTGVLVLPANEARSGGQIVNSGGFAVILYLTANGRATSGVPAIWLAANGGSWDFKLSNLLWCGSLSAVAQGTASTLSVAEV